MDHRPVSVTINSRLQGLSRQGSQKWLAIVAKAMPAFTEKQGILGIVLCLLLSSVPFARAGEIDISMAPIIIDPLFGGQVEKNNLRWLGGFYMWADHADFGGFSGLSVSQDGKQLISVTDRGAWLRAELAYDDFDHPKGLGTVVIGRLRGPDGQELNGERMTDAESLDLTPGGTLLVAFESDHRIWAYAGGLSEIPKAFADPAIPFHGARNRGLEAVVGLATGELLAITEGRVKSSSTVAFLFDGTAWHQLVYRSGGGYRPVGAARLPSGDVLVLERKYVRWSGFQARIRRIRRTDIHPGAVLDGELIVSFGPSTRFFNLEGLAVHFGPNQSTLVTLISDDNFRFFLPNVILFLELIE